MIDKKLLSILVCPVSKGALTYVQAPANESAKIDSEDIVVDELRCKSSGLAYPVRDGIPVMLEGEARQMKLEEIEALA